MTTSIDRQPITLILCFLLLTAGAVTETLATDESVRGVLESYVAMSDDSFRWERRHMGKILASDYMELKLVSQTWRDVPWKHQLFVLKPSTVEQETKHALLFVAGGRWKAEMDEEGFHQQLPNEAVLFATIAEQLRTPIAVLLHVPYQPLFDGKVEDEIIAYTFDRFIQTGDVGWPLLLPMVKATVQAMNVVQHVCKENWQFDIEHFTVTGASKRGWTTWLTGAVDRRVSAIAPIVIDVVNMGPQMQHQADAWGALSEQIDDYTRRGLPEKLSTPRGRQLLSIVDPYSYRQQLQQPKLLIIGTNDPYWPLDALNLYWHGLNGAKHILYVPNNDHSIRDFSRLSSTLSEFHRRAADGRALPEISWAFTLTGGMLELVVHPNEEVSEVRMWTAASNTRDFRAAHWSFEQANRQGGRFSGKLTLPGKGYAAVFAESVYTGTDAPFFLSTNVRIVDKVGWVSERK